MVGARFRSKPTEVIQEAAPTKTRRKTKLKIKPSMIAMYVGGFAVLIAIISLGYQAPQNKKATGSSATDVANVIDKTSVDSVVATSVAASVANTVNLPVATAVANLAVSTQIKSDYTQASDGTIASKPQIIDTVESNRLVISYTTVEGDTVSSLAKKYSISAQTIKWANNLTSDLLTVGKVLRILPIDGVLYSVQSSDTIDSIAKKYNVDKTRLVLYNDLDVSGLKPSTSIILPSATLPENERPGYVAPAPVINYSASFGVGFSDGRTWFIKYGTPDNGLYAHGNCTLYAYNRRKDLGLPVGDHWGNATSWDDMAALPVSSGGGGLLVNHTPSAGSIMQNNGGYGHVAIVESILPNGDLSISEMNASYSGGGWNIVSGRIVPAGNVIYYNFIH